MPDLKSFKFVPVLPLRHDTTGVPEPSPYIVYVVAGTTGVTDLAGNPLQIDPLAFKVAFTLDPAAPAESRQPVSTVSFKSSMLTASTESASNCKAMRTPSLRWRTARTAALSLPPAATKPSDCGTSSPARKSAATMKPRLGNCSPADSRFWEWILPQRDCCATAILASRLWRG